MRPVRFQHLSVFGEKSDYIKVPDRAGRFYYADIQGFSLRCLPEGVFFVNKIKLLCQTKRRPVFETANYSRVFLGSSAKKTASA